MQNVQAEVKAGKLIITVDLSQRLGPSKTGKSVIVATTGGNARVPGKDHDAVKFGLNVFEGRS
jgi:hypothetical protein